MYSKLWAEHYLNLTDMHWWLHPVVDIVQVVAIRSVVCLGGMLQVKISWVKTHNLHMVNGIAVD